jgi:hypothetical protein
VICRIRTSHGVRLELSSVKLYTLRGSRLDWSGGSRRSTRWSATRLGHLLSIEYDPVWHAKANRAIADLGNVECRLIPPEHPFDEPCRPGYDALLKYVAGINDFSNNSIDFVVVDGHYRSVCVKYALTKLKPTGFLLVHDCDWLTVPQWRVPQSWRVAHKSHTPINLRSLAEWLGNLIENRRLTSCH